MIASEYLEPVDPEYDDWIDGFDLIDSHANPRLVGNWPNDFVYLLEAMIDVRAESIVLALTGNMDAQL